MEGKLLLIRDTMRYQRLLKSPAAEHAGLLSQDQARKLPNIAYILTGDKTPEYGGGPSPYGFLMREEKIVGRVKLGAIAVGQMHW